MGEGETESGLNASMANSSESLQIGMVLMTVTCEGLDIWRSTQPNFCFVILHSMQCTKYVSFHILSSLA